MRIAMIGTGYVGLVSGTCFSQFGIDVTCVDLDENKISRLKNGEVPIYEPGLEQMVHENAAAGRLKFTTSLAEGVSDVDAVFIAVGTPTRHGDGHADLSYVYAAAEEIAKHITGYTVIVDKSTVPVGTARQVADIIRKTNPDADFDVVSNPEFLREGAAISDFTKPDRVVIGAETERAKQCMERLYQPIVANRVPLMITGLETAELIKYASNAFLAVKIGFVNELADLCEKVGGDIMDVAQGMGLDARIGSRFLQPGPGYGGSCFPKDTLALMRTGQECGAPVRIVEAVVDSNDRRKKSMADRVVAACDGSVEGKTVAILGFTFKAETDDMRDSPALDIVPALQKQGARIKGFDPKGMEEAAKLLDDVEWQDDAYAAMEDADVAVILTEWNIFRQLDRSRVRDSMARPVVVDLRNLYDPEQISAAGITYHSVGR
ncbi:UDP-glucose dehydrogenase family protein [Aestuariispira insulae]|uniref:UDP-glucose 6-dehydrogenase n=1 Tax=Aestuariispira insulae TaxID=1461337 RepID=A0A3D9HJX3_9PROT|nr:UDP-glucose/GDP-mannose dehydrogenase family protein [Aestuariispira insulae]RED49809.1 UDP-glucose dehydrogenase [Aestuariispira insulae]